jgi:hypothetical protein
MEGSFAQSANCHGFKRARWRRLWRQQIQDWLIAACQNVKTLVRARQPRPLAVTSAVERVTAALSRVVAQCREILAAIAARILRDLDAFKPA